MIITFEERDEVIKYEVLLSATVFSNTRPVELVFSIMKNFISKKRNSIKLNFNKKSGRRSLKDSLKRLDKLAGQKLWSSFIIETKKIFVLVRDVENEQIKIKTCADKIQSNTNGEVNMI